MYPPHLPYLPPEIWDIIYRDLHKSYMKDLQKEIIHNVVWIRLNKKLGFQYSFMVCRGNNYYKALDWDSD